MVTVCDPDGVILAMNAAGISVGDLLSAICQRPSSEMVVRDDAVATDASNVLMRQMMMSLCMVKPLWLCGYWFSFRLQTLATVPYSLPPVTRRISPYRRAC